MKALVTGGRGFVAPHLARTLEAAGHEVVLVDRDALDVTDASACAAAMRRHRPDLVFHLAGVTHVEADPAQTYRVNALGGLHVLDAVRREAPAARVLVASSAYVYGRVPPEEQPIPETRSPRPVNHYGASKAALEAVASAAAAEGVRVVVARAFNHVGPGQSPAFVVPALARQVVALAGGAPGPLRLGNAEPVRDVLDVRDVCEAYALLVERAAPGDVVNVCSGTGVPIRQLAERLLDLAGVKAELATEPARVRAGDVPSLVGDPSRLLALGWRRRRSLDEALRSVLAHASA